MSRKGGRSRSPFVLLMILLVLVTAACSKQSVASAKSVVDERLESLFTQQGVTGCFVLFDPQKKIVTVHNPERIHTRLLPASTFKILNSLIALEEGAIPGVDTVVPWNGTDYGWNMWNRDQTMRSAIACSAVWVYQEFARRIGQERMQHWVRKIGYGNADISGNVDSFWLDGALRISAMEQIAILQRLHDNALPFSLQTMQSVREILAVEITDVYTLYAKTGWATRVTPQIGWQVGWVQKGDDVYYYALNIDITNRKDAKMRDVLMREGLHAMGII